MQSILNSQQTAISSSTYPIDNSSSQQAAVSPPPHHLYTEDNLNSINQTLNTHVFYENLDDFNPLTFRFLHDSGAIFVYSEDIYGALMYRYH